MNTYLIKMNKTGTGGKFHSEVSFTVRASSETMAIKEAERRHPELKVCYIELQ